MPAPQWLSSRVLIAIALFAIVAVQAIVLLFGLGLGDVPLKHFDYVLFDRLAVNMLDHATFAGEAQAPFKPTLSRTPGYPLFVAAVYVFAGREPLFVYIAQFVLLWLTGIIIFLIGNHFFSLLTSFCGSVFVVTYPLFVFMATTYSGGHSQCLFLLGLAVLLLLYMKKQTSYPLAIATLIGLVLGVAALFRPGFSMLAVCFACSLMLGRDVAFKQRLLRSGVILLGNVMVLAPWIIRNNVLTDGQSGIMIRPGGWELYCSAKQYSGEVSYKLLLQDWDLVIAEFNKRNAEFAMTVGSDSENSLALQQLKVEESFLRDVSAEMKDIGLWKIVMSFPQRFFWLWSTADVAPWPPGIYHRFVQAFHILLTGLGIAGLFFNRKSLMSQWPLWILAVYQSLLHIVVHVEPRYSLEARLFLCLYSADALVLIFSQIARTLQRKPVVNAQTA